ncbi:MFS transporter [Peribacillus huizhouensis]|uniref:Putative proline/betaine transporter n=1 Tax=Peribacillus huizhouensis TaxID=1501239 RepID=A0ABR6CTS8_9BACI|nr:MFS transporter [Peribacillus huizhouensis]MBA9028355.1 MHS family proline/betaine transporter-like MFS transporter [Peribacillus huizhouensis]
MKIEHVVQPGNRVEVKPSDVKRAVMGASIGNLIEWFDYASYGYLATIIAVVFFPAGNPKLALLATFGVFAVSFIARPIGGIIWGHYGDKLGRKKILILTLLLMSLSTFAIGIIPNYATIGIAAPLLLLLCRIVQGFSASGEYAGASLFIAEYAPKKRRGLLVSMVPASTAAGLMLGALAAFILEASLSQEAMQAWGWRIPFLLAGPLCLIALYLRMKLEDTPVFNEIGHSEEQLPIVQTVKLNWKQIIVAFGVVLLNAAGFYIILSYMPTYLTNELNFTGTKGILTTLVSLATYVIFLPMVGALADRVGRKPVLIGACISFIVLSYPAFLMLTLGGIWPVIALILLGAILAGNDGVLATFLTEMFPTKVRYTCFGLSFNLGNAIFGGTAPFIATFLIIQTDNQFAPAFYLMAAALVALLALMRTKETAHKNL